VKARPNTRKIAIAYVSLLAFSGLAQAQDDAKTALNRALDLLEDNDAREAVAVLADAARRYPQDRKIGGLFYTLLRDKRWPLPATLPVKLPSAITVLRFSPDAKLVITGAEDGTVRILDSDSGKLLDATVKHPGAVVCVAILPGNERAFSLGKAGDAHVWKIADGSTIRKWSNGDSAFSACAISRDYRRLALGYANGEVRVYDRELGKQLGEAVKHSNAITSLAFSPDGETLGTGSADGTARASASPSSPATDVPTTVNPPPCSEGGRAAGPHRGPGWPGVAGSRARVRATQSGAPLARSATAIAPDPRRSRLP